MIVGAGLTTQMYTDSLKAQVQSDCHIVFNIDYVIFFHALSTTNFKVSNTKVNSL